VTRILIIIAICLFSLSCKDHVDIKYIAHNAPKIINGTEDIYDVICIFKREENSDELYISYRTLYPSCSTGISINEFSPLLFVAISEYGKCKNIIKKYNAKIDIDRKGLIIKCDNFDLDLQLCKNSKIYYKKDLQMMIAKIKNKNTESYLLINNNELNPHSKDEIVGSSGNNEGWSFHKDNECNAVYVIEELVNQDCSPI